MESKYLSMQLRLMGRSAEIMRIFCSREGRVLNRSVALIRPFRIKLSYSLPKKVYRILILVLTGQRKGVK